MISKFKPETSCSKLTDRENFSTVVTIPQKWIDLHQLEATLPVDLSLFPKALLGK
jgi:hypothetical protein